MQSHFHIALLQ